MRPLETSRLHDQVFYKLTELLYKLSNIGIDPADTKIPHLESFRAAFSAVPQEMSLNSALPDGSRGLPGAGEASDGSRIDPDSSYLGT